MRLMRQIFHHKASCTVSLFIVTAAATIRYNLSSLQLVQGLTGHGVPRSHCPPVLPDAAAAAEPPPAVSGRLMVCPAAPSASAPPVPWTSHVFDPDFNTCCRE